VIRFARETLGQAYADALELTRLHYEEIAPYQDIFKLKPDLDSYHRLEKSGALVVITAREDGILVGYFLMIVRSHPHYSDTIVANEDMKYVHPDYRGKTGMGLIRFAEQEARRRGCKVMLQRSKARSEHGSLYRRLGYELLDEIWAKRLDKEVNHGY
jgi:GNAT superfamily N-acetyltransferase